LFGGVGGGFADEFFKKTTGRKKANGSKGEGKRVGTNQR